MAAADIPEAPSHAATAGPAERYARALLALADDRRAADPGALDRIAADLERLFALWRDDPGFQAFVGDPRLDAAEQRRATFAVLDRAEVAGEVRNLLGVMIVNRRLAALPQVAQAFGALLAARRGQQVAEVATAHPLSETQRAQLAARLTESGYSGVQLRERVDPSLLGGLVLRVGSRLYDNSIKSKLQRLQYAMKGAA